MDRDIKQEVLGVRRSKEATAEWLTRVNTTAERLECYLCVNHRMKRATQVSNSERERTLAK